MILENLIYAERISGLSEKGDFVNIKNTNTMALFHKKHGQSGIRWCRSINVSEIRDERMAVASAGLCVHHLHQHFNICTWVVCAYNGCLVTIGSRINDALNVSRSW